MRILKTLKKKKNLNSILPITKGTNGLNSWARNEQDQFFKLFDNYVDDVSVKQYTEKGGDLEYLKESLLKEKKINFSQKDNELLKDQKGDLYISDGRLHVNNLIKGCW